jgi:hypothetical protein
MASDKGAKDGGKSRRQKLVKDLSPRGRQARSVVGGRTHSETVPPEATAGIRRKRRLV